MLKWGVVWGLCAVCAPPALAFDRQEVIDRQMDCVGAHLGQSSIDWNDVCYTQNRSQVIDHALDAAQRRIKPIQKRPAPANPLVDDKSPKVKPAVYDPEGKLLSLESSFRGGYRTDNLRWNIAGTGGSPNILSELTWDSMKIAQVENSGELAVKNRAFLHWNADYGWVFAGHNQDSDYLGNNRTLEFSRSNNTSDKGHVYDVSGGPGIRFNVTPWIKALEGPPEGERLYLDVLGGYSYSQQQFFMTNGSQTIPDTGPFDGLKSNYMAQWQGGWAGAQLKGRKENFFGTFRVEYHWARYMGMANWNLRSDFLHPKSYKQVAIGDGLVFRASGSYYVSPFWSLDLGATYQRWQAKNGTVTFFLSDGTKPQQPFNEVVWDSFAITIGNTIHF